MLLIGCRCNKRSGDESSAIFGDLDLQMIREEEKLELARLVTATEGLLHKMRMQHILKSNYETDTPALTLQQCHMISIVNEKGPITICQLAQALLVKAPTASTMVNRLVCMGILTRNENPRNRREVLIRISPKYLSEIEAIRLRYLQTILDVFEKIGVEHARMWGSVCERIKEAVPEGIPLQETNRK
jgi:DNA-binding MarR family transcriptional regulator